MAESLKNQKNNEVEPTATEPIEPTETVEKETVEAAFFKAYPNAPSVFKVAECLFLYIHSGAAKEYAHRIGAKLEEIKNPNLVIG